MRPLLFSLRLAALALGLLAAAGCTTPASIALSAAGVASDQSLPWEIVKFLHARLTEGDPTPCLRVEPVERALSPRCAFDPRSLHDADLVASPFGACALATAASDPRIWPVLPALMAHGARSDTCTEPALVALAQANDCPSLADTSPEVRAAFETLARTDGRNVEHDVVRWLSCPASRAAGLDHVLDTWLARGALDPGRVDFSPLSALDPGMIRSPLSAALEARGHTAAAAFDGYRGQRPGGFEAALRASDWAALDWWIAHTPVLADRVPGPQLAWRPLAKVLTPGFLAWPQTQGDMVGYLLARGADPRGQLPAAPGMTVLDLARSLNSPELARLEAAPATRMRVAGSSNAALRLMGP